MYSPLFLIGEAWKFYQKQSVLFPVTMWLLFVPGIASRLAQRHLFVEGTEISWSSSVTILLILALLASSVVFVWGSACVLVSAKRILNHPAGRTRTSFSAVRSQGARVLMPLLLTGLLRDCFTVLWALLLLIPGILYALATTFYAVAVVCEDLPYRAGLRRSKDVMMRGFGLNALSILALNVVLYLPIVLMEQTADALIPASDVIPQVLMDVFLAGLTAIATTLSLLSLVHLYGLLRAGDEGMEEPTA